MTKPRRRSPVKERRLVVIDQAPLRKKASAECAKVMNRLRKARADWTQYEMRDLSAFERWMSATFGALLTEVREAEERAGQLDVLVAEVESLYAFGICRTKREAYQRVTAPPPPPGAAREEEESFGPDEEFDEFDLSEAFEDLLMNAFGIDPDRMSDREYEKMFSQFKATFGKGAPPPPFEEKSPPSAAPEPPPASRLKTLYRTLVRRLHPDVRAGSDAQTSALWHEVQEAYAGRDEERLEILSALTDLHEGEVDSRTSLWQLRGVLQELQRSLRALQKNMRRVKKHPAWGFATKSDHRKLETDTGRELQRRKKLALSDIAYFESQIARWKAPGRSMKGKSPSKSRPAARQDEFFF